MRILVAGDDLPTWFEYPDSFCRIVEQGLVDLTPWHLLEAEVWRITFVSLDRQYSTRALFPFAYRQDNDDLACWEKGQGESVVVIHNHASPGFENVATYESFWSWFRSAIEDMIDFEP